MSGALPGSVAKGGCEHVVDPGGKGRGDQVASDWLERSPARAWPVIIRSGWSSGLPGGGDDHGLGLGRDALSGFPADGAGTAGCVRMSGLSSRAQHHVVGHVESSGRR
jgi:hypothetical protein